MSIYSKQQLRELIKINKHISSRAKELRIKNKISQSDIARCLSMSRNSVSDMMSGDAGFTPRTLYLLCSIFKCEIPDLFLPQGTFAVSEIKTKKVSGIQKVKLKIS